MCRLLELADETFFLASLTIGAFCAPAALPAQTAAPAASIRDVAGDQFVLVARGDGSVVAWGRAPGGALAVPAPSHCQARRSGSRFGESGAYVLLEDGGVVASGCERREGQHGNGPSGSNRPLGTYPERSVTPVRVTDLAGVVAIEAGRKHAIA